MEEYLSNNGMGKWRFKKIEAIDKCKVYPIADLSTSSSRRIPIKNKIHLFIVFGAAMPP